MVVSWLNTRDHDGLIGDASVTHAQIGRPALQVGLESLATLAVVRPGGVHALGGLEVALEELALVPVDASRNLGEGAVFSASNDIGADSGISAVTLDTNLIAIAELGASIGRPIDNKSVFNLGEAVAANTRARRGCRRPCSVALAQQNGQASPLVTLVTLVANNGAVVQPSSSEYISTGILDFWQRGALGR